MSQMHSDSLVTGSITGIEETWRQIKLVMNGASSSMFVDGVSKVTGSQGTTKFRQFKFSSSSSESSWIGDYGEVLIYNRVLTSAEIEKVESYLNGKWGL